MKMAFLSAAVGLIVATSVTRTEAVPSYHVIVLGPAGKYSYAYAIGGGQVGGMADSIPVLWPGLGPEMIPLSDGARGMVNAVDGVHQVGYVENSTGAPQATLWGGSAQSAMNLNPVGYSQSHAFALLGDYQAGSGAAADGQLHALLWHGSADSANDLNPPGYISSQIFGMSEDYLVGTATPAAPGATSHAFLWNRQTGDVLDLGAGGFHGAAARAISGSQIVGRAADNTSGDSRALLWNGWGASGTLNLTPMDTDGASIYGTNGTQQVGLAIYYRSASIDEAVLWSGTGETLLNLHAFLPKGTESSAAYAIDMQGRVAGYFNAGISYQAVVWIPDTTLPDPSAACVVSAASLLAVSVRRLRRRQCWKV